MKIQLQKRASFYFAVLAFLMVNLGWGQGTETFESSNLTSSYLTGTFTGDNSIQWSYVGSRDQSTYGITNKGIMFEGATSAKITSGSISGGIGSFTCKLKKAFTGPGNRQVELFINGVSKGVSIAWDNTNVQIFTVSNINISGNITIEIKNKLTKQVVIDDISWTAYSVPSNIAPTASSVSLSGTTTVGQTLTGSYTYADSDSDLEGTSTFQWYRADNASGLNSAAISGATATTYTLQVADDGKYIRFGVIPVAQTGTSPGVEAFSSWQGPVTDPTAVTATLSTTSALTEANLTAEILTINLSNTTFVDNVLATSNFTLNNAPAGVTVNSVVYNSSTSALLTFAYDGTDFDTNISNLSITIAGSELTSGANLTTSTLPITALTETLSVSTITDFGSQCLNTETTKTFTVSGTNLKAGNVNLASLTGFTYSLNGTTFNPTITIATSGGTLAATTVYVKFIPTLVQSYNGNIVVSGVGAPSVNRSVTGSGVNTPPSITTPTSTAVTVNSAILGGNITVLGCTNVTERGIYYSTTSGFADGAGTKVSETGASYTTGAFTTNVSGLSSGTIYYYKAFATSASGTVYTTQGTFTTVALTAPVATAATNVGETSFTANWNAVAEATSYVIDVYEKAIEENIVVAAWTFPTSGTILTADIFNSNNSGKLISTNGGSIIDASGATTRAPSVNAWQSGSNSKFWEVSNINFQDIYNLKVSSKQTASNTGPRDFKLQYNTGSGWLDVTNGNITLANNFTNGVLENLTLPEALENISSVSFRWIMRSNTSVNSGTVASGGTSRIDDIYFNGDKITVVYLSGYQNLNVGNVTTYQVTGLSPNKNYFYVVRAIDGGSPSVNSNEIAATTDGPFLWTGTTNNLWNVATNWFGGVVPDGSKDVIIASGTPQLNVNYTIPTDTSISIEGSGNLNIAAANTLTLIGDLSIASGAQITNAGTIEVSEGTITDNRATKNYAGMVKYNGTSNQDILGAIYNDLEIIENNTKSLIADTTVNGTLFLTEGTLNNSTFLTLGNGATINRSGGVLNEVPTFTTSVNVTYSENNALITTGNEIPSVDTVLNNLTINNTSGVKATGNITVNGTLNLVTANPNATNGALEMVIDYTGYAQNPYGTGDYTNSTASFNNLNSYVLTMGPSATTVGIGDVTGKIRRTSLVDNTTYTFGNKNTQLRLNSVSGSAIPSQITVVATRGTYGTHIDNTGGVAINGTTANRNAVQRLYQILRTGGDVASRFTLRMAYEDGDLNGNTEANLVSWDHHLPYGAITPHEHGKTSANATENWVELSNHSVNYLATEGATAFTKYWMLSAKESLNDYEWLGAVAVPGQTNWNITENWKSGKYRMKGLMFSFLMPL